MRPSGLRRRHALSLMLVTWRTDGLSNCLPQRGIGFCGKAVELDAFVRDAAIGPDDEQIAGIDAVTRRAVQLADHLPGVASEDKREARLPSPCGKSGVCIGAYAEHDDLFPTVEERGVLITVRLHLNRS